MAAKHSTLTADELRAALDYDPETGVFTWRTRAGTSPEIKRWNTRYANTQAGRILKRTASLKYRQINLGGTRYRAHRLAWLHVHDEWPEGEIDHVNGDGLDNRIENLRVVDHSQNMWNRRVSKNNTTGFPGVTRKGSAFQAYIDHRGRRLWLGTFPTPEEAHAAHVEKAEELRGGFT